MSAPRHILIVDARLAHLGAPAGPLSVGADAASPRATDVTWRDALQAAGHLVDRVSSAPEALAALAATPFDVAIISTAVPEADTVVTRAAKTSARILLTADDYDNHAVVRALRTGVYALLCDTMPITELLAMVAAALASQAHDLPAIEIVSAEDTWLEVLVPCSLRTEERLLSFLTRLHSDIPDSVRDPANQALRELLTNAVEWGGRLDPERDVRVTCVRGNRLVLYRIADPGPGFQLHALPHAAVNNPADRPLEHAFVREEKKIRPGGFGISLVRGLVDELLYNERHNEVIFIKYLDPGA